MGVKNKNKHAEKWLLCSLKCVKAPLVLLVIFNAAFSLLSVSIAVISCDIIDFGFEKNLEKSIQYGVLLIVVIAAMLVLRFFCRYYSEYISIKIENYIRQNTFKNILKKDYEKVSCYHSADLMNRMTSDVTVCSDAIANTLPSAVAMITRLIAALAVLIALDTAFAAVFIVAGAVLYVTARLLRSKLKILHTRSQEAESKVRMHIQENVEGLLAVRVFSSEDKAAEKTDKLQNDLLRAKIKRAIFIAFSNVSIIFVFRAGYVYGLIWCALGLYNGTIASVGTITAILQLISQVQQPFTSISGLIPKYYAALASAERIMEIDNLENEPEIDSAPVDADEVYSRMKSIEFDDVSFAYSRDSVIKNADITINKGDFTAITGRSGIGKSTLFKLLLGVYHTFEGSITISTDSESIAVNRLTRSMFAYVPQGNMLFSGTIKDNISFMRPDATEEEIKTAARICCADGFIQEFPDGFDTFIGEKGAGLSEGQAQRIALARAIVSGAPILLLDEATSALDEQTEAELLKNIRKMSDKTCLIVTHRSAALEVCDKQIIINEDKRICIK